MPTFRPRSRRPSARLTAVVDLPTPPLPEATAITASTPGMPGCTLSAGWAWARAAGAAGAPAARGWVATCAGLGPRVAAPAARSAVKATRADCTPGIARTASSAVLRTGSQAFTADASTAREKNTLPSLTTMSDSTRASVSAAPPGDDTFASALRTCSLVAAIIVLPFHPPARFRRHHKLRGRAVNVPCYQEWLTRPRLQ